MSIGIALSPFALDQSGDAVDAAIAHARVAAEVGLRSVWLGQTFSHDALLVAAIVGREVPGIEVGTSVVPVPGRHPLLVASQAQTAQAATGGRFTLGLGLGARELSERAFGGTFDRPAARLREFLTVLRSVLDTGAVDFHGETVTAATPMPAAVAGAKPTVPVLVAAMGPQAVRATGELADGTLPFLVGPDALAEHIVEPLRAAAKSAGRPRPRVVALVPGVVTSDLTAARAAAEANTAFYDTIPSYQRVIALSGVDRAADLVVLGDEETVAARVAEYFAAGATDVVFSQTDLTTPEDQRRTWALLGELQRAG
ncbi:TIGR03564 family F420-dependent LLM class oxidoreductase [Nocardia asteroides]|uniref:TIGR03564 family F420-dependent LLM class oxidoreductase n=1 Tax=Nocardia asteroides TaxID=1824 RepID=UPI001E3741BF|nr:TIGR03564 family F420-dependent LLM class oxidoreductase [Nocardia asteroides]UGT54644.1 TIGR03564 family F420-dependent LLM class oxidoreductase [Nocardia asteroides]